MKVGIFTDPHYSLRNVVGSCRHNSDSLRKIKEAYGAFKAEKCDLVICLGDLIDKDESHAREIDNLKTAAQVINGSRIPTMCLMGNHDAFTFETDEFYAILDGCVPRELSVGDTHLLFLDACYFKNGVHYRPGDSAWTDTFYPEAEALSDKLAAITGDVYLFMHQNIDPTVPANHRLFNADKLCQIIQHCAKVKTVFQGHYHVGSTYECDGVKYVTLPAMCQNEDAYDIITL